MPLTLAPEEKILKVLKVLADEKTKKHLESLGITIGAEITVLANNGGSLILSVKGSKLALDREVATKILVA